MRHQISDSTPADSTRRRISRGLLAALFIGAGVMHFVIPTAYMAIVPHYLPWPRALVLVSGAAEIAGGLGLLLARTRRAAGLGLVLLLAAVWPANWQMALDAADASGWKQMALWLRLPLQLPLAWWVWWATRPLAAAEARPRPARPTSDS